MTLGREEPAVVGMVLAVILQQAYVFLGTTAVVALGLDCRSER